MSTMNLISRHEPTPEQIRLAEGAGYELVHVGDVDAFDHDAIMELFNRCDGITFAVAHAGLAMQLAMLALACDIEIAIFRNSNRAPEGERPTFAADRLDVYRIRELTGQGIRQIGTTEFNDDYTDWTNPYGEDTP
jgi:hypothetical protein